MDLAGQVASRETSRWSLIRHAPSSHPRYTGCHEVNLKLSQIIFGYGGRAQGVSEVILPVHHLNLRSFHPGEDSLSNCEYGRCGTKGHREREKPSWQAQVVLRIWAEKSPQTWKDWKVCKHCCDLMIHDLQVEEMGYEKHLLSKAESQ